MFNYEEKWTKISEINPKQFILNWLRDKDFLHVLYVVCKLNQPSFIQLTMNNFTTFQFMSD